MVELLAKTDDFVKQLFEDELPKTCIYHNYMHTKRVVKSTKEIIEKSEIKLKDEEEEILLLAAYLHDTGYTQGNKDHEEKGAVIAEEFLKEEGVSQAKIEKVKKLILATKMSVTPETDLEKIIRDADASHFAKDYYPEASEYLRQELRIKEISDYTIDEWRKKNIEMFTVHHNYFTEYALKEWRPEKERNLKTMLKTEKKFKKARKKEKIKVHMKDQSPEKAIQSMWRTALRNHIKLSDIADTKANILLSVNAIIISMALSNLIPKLDNPSNKYLLWPTIIFIVFSVIAMVLSVLATRPNVTRGQFSKEDVENKEVNLLFFGNFHRMELKEYEWAINEMLKDKDYIYSALTKDLYFLGVVLDRKYRILRITYTVFMIGIILTVISFAVFFKMQEVAPEVLPAAPFQ